jgi:hypothetical protein
MSADYSRAAQIKHKITADLSRIISIKMRIEKECTIL